jgi:hypothetical protein
LPSRERRATLRRCVSIVENRPRRRLRPEREKAGRVRRFMLAPYTFEGISTWLQLDRFTQVVERTKGAR